MERPFDILECGRSPYMHQRLGTLAEPELSEFGGYLFVGGYLA